MENGSIVLHNQTGIELSLNVMDISNHTVDQRCAVEQEVSAEIIVAVIMGTVGVLINLLSLLAICHVSVKITTHFRLIVSLAFSDIIVGVTLVLLLLHNTINPMYVTGCGPDPSARVRSKCMYVMVKAVNSAGLTVCLLNLIGMAIDHYIAILKPFEYNKILGKKYGTVMIIVIWFTGILIGFSDCILQYPDIPADLEGTRLIFCEKVLLTDYSEEYCIFALTFVAGVVIVYAYLKIYAHVKALQFREASIFLHSSVTRSGGSKVNNFTRSKKALFTTLLIIGIFLICWLPLCLFEIILLIYVHVDPLPLLPHIQTLTKVDRFLYNMMLVNVLVDPIIYAVRIRDIRQGYFRFLLRFRNRDKLDNLSKSYTTTSAPVGREKSSLTRSEF